MVHTMDKSMLRRFESVRRHFSAACSAYNIPMAWLCAIARQESGFKADARVLTGGDGARGGAYGLCQMTLQTARLVGYTGDAEELSLPDMNCHVAAQLIYQLMNDGHRFFADIASAYNSGKPLKRAPESTRKTYVPNVLKYAAEFEAMHLDTVVPEAEAEDGDSMGAEDADVLPPSVT